VEPERAGQGRRGGCRPEKRRARRAVKWFARLRGRGWATCPLTETGFVRLVSNPAFSRDAVQSREALHVISVNTRRGHALVDGKDSWRGEGFVARIERDPKSRDGLAVAVGEANGPLPTPRFVDDLEHHDMEARLQVQARHRILIGPV
jgi:predicted nucleic acid-binding protein